MDTVAHKLRALGIPPAQVLEPLARGEIRSVLEILQREEHLLALRRAELEDLREELLQMAAPGQDAASEEDELGDEDLELLSAAGKTPRLEL